MTDEEITAESSVNAVMKPFDATLSRRMFTSMRLPPPEMLVEQYPQVVQDAHRDEVALNRAVRHVEIQVYQCWESQFRLAREMQAIMQMRIGKWR